jgi:hypothetical protein
MESRVMEATVVAYGELWQCAAVYAPNTTAERRQFLAQLSTLNLQQHNIVAGDWNTYQSRSLDHDPPLDGPDPADWQLITTALPYAVDTFRVKHPDLRVFTHRQRTISSQLVSTRIDCIFLHNQHLHQLAKVEVDLCSYSDHRAVLIDIAPPQQAPRPRWKFNAKLLTCQRYRHQTTVALADISNPQQWDATKIVLKAIAIEHGIQMASTTRHKLIALRRRWMAMDRNPLAQREQLIPLETEIQNLEDEATEGIKIRSRASWLEWGEKCSQYFFHRYQAQRSAMAATRIQPSEMCAFTSTASLHHHVKAFYHKLYNQNHTSSLDLNQYLTDAHLP